MAVFLLAGMVIVGAGIKLAAPVLVPLLLGSLIAIVTLPLVRWLQRLGTPRVVAVTAAVITDATVVGGLGWLLTASVGQLTERLPAYGHLVTQNSGAVTEWLQGIHPQLRLPDFVDGSAVARSVAALVGDFAGFLTDLTLSMILAAFLMFDLARPKDETRASAGTPDRVRRAVREVNKYVVIKTLVSMVTGLLIAGWLYLVGDELPVLFGVMAFVLNYIPNLGSILASIPAVALALLQGGVAQATLTAAGYLMVNVLIGNVIEPRIMGRALGLSPVVIILSVILWGWLLGPVGALMSALLTVLVKLGLSSTDDLRPFALALGPVPLASPQIEEDELVEMIVPQSSGEPTPPPPSSAAKD
jgi:predicted PurR-regulated permease PerM